MKWAELDNHYYSAPFRIYRNTQGFDVWIYGKEHGLLQRGFKTAAAAKAFCEAYHKPDPSVAKPEGAQTGDTK